MVGFEAEEEACLPARVGVESVGGQVHERFVEVGVVGEVAADGGMGGVEVDAGQAGLVHVASCSR